MIRSPMLAEAPPHSGQIGLLAVAIGLFAIGLLLSLLRLTRDAPGPRLGGKICTYLGIAVALGVLVWHSIDRGGWAPLGDNFDALIWLALLLAIFVRYMQRGRPLQGMEWFLTPIVILLLIAAAVFGVTRPQGYELGSVWFWVHRVASFGGAAAFAVAFATGGLYLIVNRRLRRKTLIAGPNLGSLERLEHLTFTSVSLGFALLTVGAVTGLVRWANSGHGSGNQVFFDAKVLLSVGVWIIYAIVLHTPLNPSLRGRWTAILSVTGFVMMVGILVAVQLIGGR